MPTQSSNFKCAFYSVSGGKCDKEAGGSGGTVLPDHSTPERQPA